MRDNLEKQIENAYRTRLMEVLVDPEKKIACIRVSQVHVVSIFDRMDPKQILDLTFVTSNGEVSLSFTINIFDGSYSGSIYLIDIDHTDGYINSFKDLTRFSDNAKACCQLIATNREELRLLAWIW